ncbi:MAG: hypothetical protein ACYC1D_20180 [Acidimicrobiales bacterium]
MLALERSDGRAEGGGVVYLRTARGAYPVIYPAGESFAVGGSKVPEHAQ